MYPGYIETRRLPAQLDRLAPGQVPARLHDLGQLPYFKGDVLRMPVVLLQSLQTGQQIYVMNFQNPADVRGNAEKWRRIGQRHQIALANLLKVSNGLPILWTGDFERHGPRRSAGSPSRPG